MGKADPVCHIFTVDLEEWFHGLDLAPSDWPRESRVARGLTPVLELLGEFDVRATFFVLGAVAERNPRLVAEIADQGHEIASHGHMHQLIYQQDPAQFRSDVRRATAAIASASGVVPRGYRAPSFSVTKRSLWALDILREEGFDWDCSIFPVIHDRYGIPRAMTSPWKVGSEDGLLEWPMSTVRVMGHNVAFSGGAYLRVLPLWAQRWAWRRAATQGQSVVLYIHPWELDPFHPRVKMSRRLQLTHYARLGSTQRSLRQLLTSYKFRPMGSAIDERSERLDGRWRPGS